MNMPVLARQAAFAMPLLTLSIAMGVPSTSPARANSLIHARSWGYQLQNADIDALKQSLCDVLVIDYSRDGSASSEFSSAEINALNGREGRPRTVLAYMSIGEAEDYRFYWQASWHSAPPHWLKAESARWQGNYPVRYWDRAWQRLLFGEAGSYLDRVLRAGFDGVYLDRVDAFAEPDAAIPEADRMREMQNLVVALARYGRERNPDFLVVPQNGEELLTDYNYRAVIDAFAKEDLFYGVGHDEAINSAADVDASLALIDLLTAEGKPLFLVEYLSRREAQTDARRKAVRIGGRLFIGHRELDHVPSC